MASDAQPTSTSGPLKIGQSIDNRYEVRALIGEGSFGLVYRGYDYVIDRDVAIKLLRPRRPGLDEDTYQRIIQRFWREAKTAGSVRNPNVVSVFDAGFVNDSPYLVLEFLPGHDLKEDLQGDDDGEGGQGPMEPNRAIHLAAQALMGLDEIHHLGIVHKDLKPRNLFVVKPESFYETLCILDFGMAGLTESDEKRLTEAGQLAGTARYFAPEYIEQEALTPRVDVYQMGLILSEMLTGSPVVGDKQVVQCVRRHKRGDLELNEDLLDSPLGPILKKATARDPDHRFGSAREFADALLELDPDTVPSFARKKQKDYRFVTMRKLTALERAAPDNPKRTPLSEKYAKPKPTQGDLPEASRSKVATQAMGVLQLFFAFLFGAAVATVVAMTLS